MVSKLKWYPIHSIGLELEDFAGDIDTVILMLEKVRDELKAEGFCAIDIGLNDEEPYSYSLWAAEKV